MAPSVSQLFFARFYGHIRADIPSRARLQDRVDHIWPCFGGGFHPNRGTVSTIDAAGFVVEGQRRFLFEPCIIAKAVAPHVIGQAGRR